MMAGHAIMHGCLVALVSAPLGMAVTPGPGSGAWEHGRPEDHGMLSSQIWKATRGLEEHVPVKHCFAVAKDGVLISETNYLGQSEERIEMDSAGKTVTALLIGVLVKQHSLNLDMTLKELNVTTESEWGTPTAADPEGAYWPRVTIRHILGQTSGIGKYEPGTEFTYDSDDYLQHLVRLIEAVTGTTSKEWATEHFAVPMGIPDLYTWDRYTTLEAHDITAGGGQFVTCTELLRFGQLILNKGRWPSKDVFGGSIQLIDEDYIDAMQTPQFPNAINNYGLLTWLSTKGAAPANCCQPQWICNLVPGSKAQQGGGDAAAADGGRWGALRTGESIMTELEFTAGTAPINIEDGIAMALGWLEKMLWVNPALNLTVVSMGYDLGGSNYCGEAYMPGTGWFAGMDSVYPMSIGWVDLQPVLQPTSAQQDAAAREIVASGGRSKWTASARRENVNLSVAEEMAAGYTAFVAAEQAERSATAQSRAPENLAPQQAPDTNFSAAPTDTDHATWQQHAPGAVVHEAATSPLAPRVRNLRRLAGRQATAASKDTQLNSTQPKFGEPGWVDSSGGGGSCQCYCPPTQGFGACKQLPSGADPSTACKTEVVSPVTCPAVGMILQCVSVRQGNISRQQCSGLSNDRYLGFTADCVEKGLQGCGDGSSITDAMSCACTPKQYDSCYFVADACVEGDPCDSSCSLCPQDCSQNSSC